jgi:hypothetical protein
MSPQLPYQETVMPHAAAIIGVVSAVVSAAQQVKSLIDSFQTSSNAYNNSTLPKDEAADQFQRDLNSDNIPQAKKILANMGIKIEAKDYIDSGDEVRELKQLFQNMLDHAQELGLTENDVKQIKGIMGSFDRLAAHLDAKGQVHDVYGVDGGHALTITPAPGQTLPAWLQNAPGSTVISPPSPPSQDRSLA